MYTLNSLRPCLLLQFLLSITAIATYSTEGAPQGCLIIPGDNAWPSTKQWDALNATVGGRLIATVPIAATCHYFFSEAATNTSIATYNAEECEDLRNNWFYPETHYENPASPMAYTFSNNSCNPWLSSPDISCTIGYHAAFSINVTGVDDIRQGLDFARRHNIRLVIRNTGHDYLGRSTGAHALALWTHHLKSVERLEYNDTAYHGPALRVGAGVQAIEAYAFADSEGLMVVGGNCPSVGLAGGYTQGGGHGPLVSTYGLGADQVLEWEVVTANGTLLTANSTHNSDLFWAMRGGGGGTFAVVVSMTVKAYPTAYASTAYIQVADNGTNTDLIYHFIGSWIKLLPKIVDSGVYALWVVNPAGFFLMPAFGPRFHQDQLDILLEPAIEELNDLGLDFTYSSSESPSFLTAYQSLTSSWNVSDYNTGGRLIPRDVALTQTDSLVNAIRNIGSRALFSGVSFNVNHSVASPDDVAVNPAFRSALFNVFLGVSINYTDWTANLASLDEITNELLPPLEKLTPGSGAYINEADAFQPDFQHNFYGDHYERLLLIKDTYDPEGTFYAQTAVGSERWIEELDGRLCRISGA